MSDNHFPLLFFPFFFLRLTSSVICRCSISRSSSTVSCCSHFAISSAEDSVSRPYSTSFTYCSWNSENCSTSSTHAGYLGSSGSAAVTDSSLQRFSTSSNLSVISRSACILFRIAVASVSRCLFPSSRAHESISSSKYRMYPTVSLGVAWKYLVRLASQRSRRRRFAASSVSGLSTRRLIPSWMARAKFSPAITSASASMISATSFLMMLLLAMASRRRMLDSSFCRSFFAVWAILASTGFPSAFSIAATTSSSFPDAIAPFNIAVAASTISFASRARVIGCSFLSLVAVSYTHMRCAASRHTTTCVQEQRKRRTVCENILPVM
mmetsp:Transcript_13121/g.32059  ORF Transcript_13121/g.32059 Transcript_13121/m.32059 type:complete len:324 (-) Transcript_13121:768-1739(-)